MDQDSEAPNHMISWYNFCLDRNTRFHKISWGSKIWMDPEVFRAPHGLSIGVLSIAHLLEKVVTHQISPCFTLVATDGASTAHRASWRSGGDWTALEGPRVEDKKWDEKRWVTIVFIHYSVFYGTGCTRIQLVQWVNEAGDDNAFS